MKDNSFSVKGKSIKEIVDYADNLFKGNEEKKIEAHKIYQLVLEKIPNLQDGEKPYVVRGIIRKRIWDCLRKLDQNLDYFSEAGQDMLVKDNFFKNQKSGFFIEIGAFDGIEKIIRRECTVNMFLALAAERESRPVNHVTRIVKLE